jgi:hypothetical protein
MPPSALVLEEGLTGSVTFRNYRAPHQYAYNPGAANPALSGRVEVRLRTAQASRVAELLDRFAEA